MPAGERGDGLVLGNVDLGGGVAGVGSGVHVHEHDVVGVEHGGVVVVGRDARDLAFTPRVAGDDALDHGLDEHAFRVGVAAGQRRGRGVAAGGGLGAGEGQGAGDFPRVGLAVGRGGGGAAKDFSSVALDADIGRGGEARGLRVVGRGHVRQGRGYADGSGRGEGGAEAAAAARWVFRWASWQRRTAASCAAGSRKRPGLQRR